MIVGGDGSGESGSQGVSGDGGDDTSGDWRRRPVAGGAGHRVAAGGRTNTTMTGGHDGSHGGDDGQGGQGDGGGGEGAICRPGGTARGALTQRATKPRFQSE